MSKEIKDVATRLIGHIRTNQIVCSLFSFVSPFFDFSSSPEVWFRSRTFPDQHQTVELVWCLRSCKSAHGHQSLPARMFRAHGRQRQCALQAAHVRLRRLQQLCSRKVGGGHTGAFSTGVRWCFCRYESHRLPAGNHIRLSFSRWCNTETRVASRNRCRGHPAKIRYLFGISSLGLSCCSLIRF